MVAARRPVLAGVLAGLLIGSALAGCGGSSGTGARQPSTPSATTSAVPPSTAGSSSGTGSSTPGPSSRAGSPTATPSGAPLTAISIPPYLCTGTDIAQNAADAYLGALSAGDLKQASACVLPHTVPAAVTRSLLGTGGRTVAYLPRDGADGPTVFGYRGNAKLIDVTVTKESDGRFWVTRVAVRTG